MGLYSEMESQSGMTIVYSMIVFEPLSHWAIVMSCAILILFVVFTIAGEFVYLVYIFGLVVDMKHSLVMLRKCSI